jgi:hypothetical protein
MNRLTIAIFVKKKVPSIALVMAASLITAVVGGASKALNASTPNPKQTSSEKARNMKIKDKYGRQESHSHFGRQ